VDRLIAVTVAATVVLAGCGRPVSAAHSDLACALGSAASGDAALAVAALAARKLFANDKACPLDRVTATEAQVRVQKDPAGPPTPELRIMACARFVTAAGCGSAAVYACWARGGPGEVPYCVAPGPPP